PNRWKFPLRINNQVELAFDTAGSVLLFDSVGQREDRSFGRSRGLNFAHLDELGAWRDQKKVAALRAAFSEEHPNRLYFEPSTAQGYDVFKDLWDEAESSPVMRRVFVGWWAHEPYRVSRDRVDVWERYGHEHFSDDERLWLETVSDRYDVRISA